MTIICVRLSLHYH